METAAKVLVVGGTLNLALAFALGFVLSRRRMASPDADASALLQCHRVALWEGFMLLGLVWAVGLSPLSSGTETLAAWLLVSSSVLQDASSIANWIQRVGDQFKERSPGFYLAAVNAVLGAVGLAILLVGVFRGL
jgi:hypothetical protein